MLWTFALCLALALMQFGRLRLLRVSFIATYALLAAYAILVALSPVNLGLNPIIATAITGLYTVTRWEPDRRWGMAALLLALAGALVNPVTLASYSRAHGIQHRSHGWLRLGRDHPLIRTLTSLVFVGAVVLTYLLASSRSKSPRTRPATSASPRPRRLRPSASAWPVSSTTLWATVSPRSRCRPPPAWPWAVRNDCAAP